MADIDLDAIRARDAENRLLRLGPDADPDLGEWMGYAVRDRRALLAEVDRLEAENRTIPPDVHVWGLATDTERARIRAAVEGLPLPDVHSLDTGCVDRAAVLDAIDGDEA